LKRREKRVETATVMSDRRASSVGRNIYDYEQKKKKKRGEVWNSLVCGGKKYDKKKETILRFLFSGLYKKRASSYST